MIYIVYWLNDYKRAYKSLCSHAVSAQVRYILLNKPYLLPPVLKRFEVGFFGNLLAVCVSSVVYTESSWRSVFGPDFGLEILSLDSSSEIEFNDWFNYHISPFSNKVVGGVVRRIVRDPVDEEVSSKKRRDEDVERDFVSDMVESFRHDADNLLEFTLREIGTQYGNLLADRQDEFLIMNKNLMIRWTKLCYYKKNGKLSIRGCKELSRIDCIINEFLEEYRRDFLETEGEWFRRFSSSFLKKKVDFSDSNNLVPEFLVTSNKPTLFSFRKWLEVEYPKEHVGYFVLPIWDHLDLVRTTLLSRVMPYEEHLRKVASKNKPKIVPKVIYPPSKKN